MTSVVTGASRGIGRAAALELAARGEALCLVGRASAGQDHTVTEARRRGVRVEAVACDLARTEEVTGAAKTCLELFGPPSVVVHNAAVIHRTPVDMTSDETWEEQLAVNLRAPFQLTRALLPAMREAGAGRFVFVGSISAAVGTARAAAYCASKWGLVGFMKSLAEEISGTGLVTVAILPGSVDTAMLEGSGFQPRMTAGDVARTIVHYALEAPAAHNGGVVEMFGT